MHIFLQVLDARSGTRVLRRPCCTLLVEPSRMFTEISTSITVPWNSRTTVECWPRQLASHISGTSTKFLMKSSHRCLSADISYVIGETTAVCVASSLFFGKLCVISTVFLTAVALFSVDVYCVVFCTNSYLSIFLQVVIVIEGKHAGEGVWLTSIIIIIYCYCFRHIS